MLLIITIILFIAVGVLSIFLARVQSIPLDKVEQKHIDGVYRVENVKPSFKILFIQPLFIPIRPYLELNINVLNSIQSYYDQHKDAHSGVDVHIQVRGFARTDEYFNEYKNRYDELVSSCSGGFLTFGELVREKYNYGQSYQYVKGYNENRSGGYDLFVTNGCDLCFPEKCNPILYRSAIAFGASPNIGLLSMGMLTANVHLYHPDKFNLHKVDVIRGEINHHFTVIYAESIHGGDIAGGLTMVRFEHAGEYVCSGVFSPDDGIIHRRIRRLGYQTAIAHDMHVVHEFGTTASYGPFMAWKSRSLDWSHRNGETNIPESELQPWAEESEIIFEEWDSSI